MKTAYITDSGTGYSMDFMAKKGIFSLPLQIEINGKNYFDLSIYSCDFLKISLVFSVFLQFSFLLLE